MRSSSPKTTEKGQHMQINYKKMSNTSGIETLNGQFAKVPNPDVGNVVAQPADDPSQFIDYYNT